MFQWARSVISFDPFRTMLPAATVLEMSAEDMSKTYVRAQAASTVKSYFDIDLTFIIAS